MIDEVFREMQQISFAETIFWIEVGMILGATLIIFEDILKNRKRNRKKESK